ncbi:MAG: hypothetical protein IPN16_17055 [Gemmatimonadetes bacterium]|nr:hypothetical protein [Gemmatimonadota bacterium]
MGAYARSVREDPIRRGLLFAATEIGVWVSLDDGANWQPLQLNLPRASVRDLRVQENDLVVATHGRSFWAIDDIAVIRQLHDSVTAKPLHLFQPSTAWRFAGGHGGRGECRRESVRRRPRRLLGRDTPTDKLTLEFVDPRGTVVRSFSSATKRDSTAKAPVDSMAYAASDSIVTTRPGTNRFFWNLRYPNAKEIKTVVNDMGTLAGPTVVPGDFRVRLIAGKDTLVRPFTVKLDPRVQATPADLQQTFDLGMKVRGRLRRHRRRLRPHRGPAAADRRARHAVVGAGVCPAREGRRQAGARPARGGAHRTGRLVQPRRPGDAALPDQAVQHDAVAQLAGAGAGRRPHQAARRDPE